MRAIVREVTQRCMRCFISRGRLVHRKKDDHNMHNVRTMMSYPLPSFLDKHLQDDVTEHDEDPEHDRQ